MSYLARIERGECYPSARVLRKMAKPLGFDEGEMLFLAATMLVSTDSERTKRITSKIIKALRQMIESSKAGKQ